MKKIFPIIVLLSMNLVFISGLFAQEMTYSNLRDGNGISVNLELKSYEISSMAQKGEEMHEIVLSGIFLPNDEGMPNLPRISRFVAIPKGAEVKVSIKSMETELVENMNIAPALRIQAIPEEPVMDFTKNAKVYSSNAFYPQNIYEVSEITSVRGVDAVIIGITPFQFNPVTKELVVINNIELDIEYLGGTREYGDSKYRSQWFDPILANVFLNYEMLPKMEYGGKSAKDGTGCEYLIVIPNREDFEPLAQQILDFRTKQGIYTKVMRLDEMNVTTTTALKTYLHDAYNNWDIPPVGVLLMGDHHTNMTIGIPAEVISHPYSGSCITDNQYADVVGNDKLPEMVLGRMAAETLADMEILVSKFFEYETQPCMDPDYYQNPITALGWQTERWFQICSEAVGGYWRNQGKTPVRINCIYSGTPGNSWSSNPNTSMVVNYFGPTPGTGYIPLNPSDLGGWNTGTPAQVVAAINNGAFALQHRDHGFVNGWGEPAFQSNHISQLTNVGKMTYLFTINCETGKFNSNSPCFGEVFHRHTFNGQNAGAVGFLGPTEVSYSFVNDAFAWGMYDLFDPQFLPDYGYAGNGSQYSGNWMPAFGNVAGKYFLAQSNWPYNPGDKIITYQMFTAHSDVFLRLFTEVPQEIAANHLDVTFAGNPNFLISANEGTLIALTAVVDGNLEILNVATATGTTQTITLPSSLPDETEINVVITGQNFKRYESVVTVIPAEGSYVTANMELSTGNEPYSGATVFFDVNLTNVGVETATDIEITLTTESEDVILINHTASLASLEAGEDELLSEIFNVEIKNYLSDGTPITFTIDIVSDNNEFNQTKKITVLAPKLKLTDIAISRVTGTGAIAPGDEVNIDFEVANVGHADIADIFSTVFSFFSGLELFENEQTIEQINVGESQHITFNGKVGDDLEDGVIIPVHFYAFKGTYTSEETSYIIIGSAMEDFETGNFLKFPWEHNSNPWEITSSDVYQGTYCARSKTNLGHNNVSQLKMTTFAPNASNVSYARNVSSENNYDWFRFYVDGVQKEQLSGTSNSWAVKSFPVEAGVHTYMFEYSKDPNTSSGLDCAWIDNVTIPGMGVVVEEDLPQIKVIDHSIEGLIDGVMAGETTITFDLKNIGVVNADGILVELSCGDYPVDIAAENSGNNQELPFSMSVNEEKSVIFNLACQANRSDVDYVEFVLKVELEETGIVAYYPVVLVCTCTSTPEPELCEPPANPEGKAELTTAVITWEEPEIDGILLGYNIYRDENFETPLNGEELLAELTYSDEGLENGKYIYHVGAVYEHCDEALTEGIEVEIDVLNINEINNDVSIYPNPTSGTVTIVAANFARVEIYNTVGQLVETKTVKSFDVSTYHIGIYFFKIYDAHNNSVTKRVMVTK